MSKEREEIAVGIPEPTTAKEKRARFAQVLERGIINTRLSVELPPDVHGEWVRNDPSSIARMQSLGFVVDDKYATANALHSDGTGKPIVGDVLFMTCSKEDYQIIQDIKRQRFMEMHMPKDAQKEEAEYAAQLKKVGDVPVIQESSTKTARRDEIASALDTAKGR